MEMGHGGRSKEVLWKQVFYSQAATNSVTLGK